MSEDGSLVASARKRGFFSNSFDMTFDRVSYSLCKNTGLKTHFELFKDNKPPAIGTIVQKQLFSANLIIDLPDSLSTKLQFFIAWLAIVLIHRSQNTND